MGKHLTEYMRSCSRLMAVMMWTSFVFVLLSTIFIESESHQIRGIGPRPGPNVIATKGEVWPRPQNITRYDGYMSLNRNSFQIEIGNFNCDILENAKLRYMKIIKMMWKKSRNSRNFDLVDTRRQLNTEEYLGSVSSLKVILQRECENVPHINMDESYDLKMNAKDLPKQAVLTANSIWGILRGLETFSQLLYVEGDQIVFESVWIKDFPRFQHRGLLIDTSRHYLPMKILYQMLDAMSYNKFNVFHWHMVDDQSFPYNSTTFPLLVKGAYTPYYIYNQKDVKDIIEYARQRGIRVLPEFDTPGHVRSWGEGYPGLLTACYDGGKPDGSYGPMNPASVNTFMFLNKLLDEILTVFSDRFFHVGADEVEHKCWSSNPVVSKFAQENNLNYNQLEEFFVQKMINLCQNKNLTTIAWQEVFDNGFNLTKDVIIQVWKTAQYQNELSKVTAKGYTALLSSPWYLDHEGTWHKYYNAEPLDFPGSAEQKKRLLGGEACMWGEHVDRTNIMTRVWPRACGVAEKLWSSASAHNIQFATKRLEEHVCRMNSRNIPAAPANGPGVCL